MEEIVEQGASPGDFARAIRIHQGKQDRNGRALSMPRPGSVIYALRETEAPAVGRQTAGIMTGISNFLAHTQRSLTDGD